MGQAVVRPPGTAWRPGLGGHGPRGGVRRRVRLGQHFRGARGQDRRRLRQQPRPGPRGGLGGSNWTGYALGACSASQRTTRPPSCASCLSTPPPEAIALGGRWPDECVAFARRAGYRRMN